MIFDVLLSVVKALRRIMNKTLQKKVFQFSI